MKRSETIVTVMLSFLTFGCATLLQSSSKADDEPALHYEGKPQEAVDAMEQKQPFYFSAFMKARILSRIEKLPTQHPEVLRKVANEGDKLVQLMNRTCQDKLNPTYAGFQIHIRLVKVSTFYFLIALPECDHHPIDFCTTVRQMDSIMCLLS
jgi:hypothetical protein